MYVKEAVYGLFFYFRVAVDPSYTIFFSETWQKRRFCNLRLSGVAAGCITILQAVQIGRLLLCHTPLSPYKTAARRNFSRKGLPDGLRWATAWAHAWYNTP